MKQPFTTSNESSAPLLQVRHASEPYYTDACIVEVVNYGSSSLTEALHIYIYTEHIEEKVGHSVFELT